VGYIVALSESRILSVSLVRQKRDAIVATLYYPHKDNIPGLTWRNWVDSRQIPAEINGISAEIRIECRTKMNLQRQS
jgi:hypothetical protein